MKNNELELLKSKYMQAMVDLKTNLISIDKFKGIKEVVSLMLERKTMLDVENRVNWIDNTRIYSEFKQIEEIIEDVLKAKKDYIFEYTYQSLDFIVDELKYYIDDEKRVNAITNLIKDLMNKIDKNI